MSPAILPIDTLRKLVLSNIELQQYGTACFWADKLVCLGKQNPSDVLLYARALYHNRQYHRAISLIKNQNEFQNSLMCRYLIAHCHYACAEYMEALELLEDPEKSSENYDSNLTNLILGPKPKQQQQTSCGNSQPLEKSDLSKQFKEDPTFDNLGYGFSGKNLHSSIALMKGKLYELLENRPIAIQFYKEALSHDVTCYEAFEKLVNFQALSSEEETTLINQLDFESCLDPEMSKLIEFLYKDKLNKHLTPENHIPNDLNALSQNVDVIVNIAGRMLDICQFQECYNITSRIIQSDPYNLNCLPIHISVLKELEKSNELFKISHKLMNVYPTSAISWFAVGCYYLCIQKNELARRHLVKASQLDRRFGPVWLTLGHAFAADGEHDQAIASYCTAAQVIRGSHIPIMYIGIEYSASNNRNLAERFLNQAYLLSSNDPFVLHELGVLAYESRKYLDATNYFSRAYSRACELSGQVPSSFWEPLVNNLGHCHRKMGLYNEAIRMHELALRLVPDSPSTLASLAMVHAITGKLEIAIDYLHRSVGIQPTGCGSTSNSVASTMLSLCIEVLTNKSIEISNHQPGKDIPDSPPQKHLPPVGPGSIPGSDKVKFKKTSNEFSNLITKPSVLQLDIVYESKSNEHPSLSLNTSIEDVSMDMT